MAQLHLRDLEDQRVRQYLQDPGVPPVPERQEFPEALRDPLDPPDPGVRRDLEDPEDTCCMGNDPCIRSRDPPDDIACRYYRHIADSL